MFQYVPTFIPNKVLIIGGGGTGSRLLPLLAQFLKTAAWIQNPEITIVDDDIVEEKNLLRQNFISIDVGKFKAEVLAQRYARAFNIPITPMVKRITAPHGRYVEVKPEEQEDNTAQMALFGKFINNAVIVMCVDSPEARRHIVGRIFEAQAHFGAYNSNLLLIDSGNENDFGQVNISTAKLADLHYQRTVVESWGGKMMGDAVIPIIPMDIDYFKDMRAETTLSCADLDQTMAINTMMAVTMFGIIQNLVYAKPVSFHRLNVSLQHGIIPEYMNPQFMLRVASPHKVVTGGFARDKGEVIASGVRIEEVITEFEQKVMAPARIAISQATADGIKAEMKKKAAQEKLIYEGAVKDTMRKYGIKDEDKVEAALSKTPGKAALDEMFLQELKSQQVAEKAPVKRVVKKGREALVDEIATTFGIGPDWDKTEF